jgi:hypothetical protein
MSSVRIRRLAAIISGALLGLALIGPAPTVAAQAGWEFINTQHLPTEVTPGKAAGYRFTIHNGGSSNIAQLYLTGSLDAAPVYLAGDSAADKLRVDQSCFPKDAVLNCAFGALNADASITLTVAYTTSGTGTFDATFYLSSTGNTGSDNDPTTGKGNSHGDSLSYTFSTRLSTNENFAGGFVLGTEPQTYEVKNGGVTRRNIQSTAAIPSGFDIPVTVEDGPNVPARTCAAVAGAFGECSKIEAAEGGDVTGGIKIVITVYWKSVPRNLNVNDVKVVHTWTDGLIEHVDTIGTSCGSGSEYLALLEPGCRDASFDADKNLIITIWTLHNGGVRGQF